jgi:phosphoribosylformylglycinamidine synthase
MSFGNNLGFEIETSIPQLFELDYGSFVIETTKPIHYKNAILLGTVSPKITINKEVIEKESLLAAWRKNFHRLYPEMAPLQKGDGPDYNWKMKNSAPSEPIYHPQKHDKVKVVIPVFPGSNCDYDTARAFEEAGAEPKIFVFRNQNEQDIKQSIAELAHLIDESQILALCGGFSSGDEPDGSGKFIANVLNNNEIKNAIEKFLEKDYLIVGICNGFQALIKSGLLPFGKIGEVTKDSPTLYRNNINRHVSQIAKTVVATNRSPWLSSFEPGDQHSVAVSHGEGKFVVSEEQFIRLFKNDQIAFCYCDHEGVASTDPEHNPNGSHHGIEGIISPCGKILGKMGHSERKGIDLYKNIRGNKTQDIFKNAVRYLKGK